MMSGITKQILMDELGRLGVRTGDSVMLHSSLSSLGYVAGGADTVVDAFVDLLGPEGTVIVPAFAGNLWKGHPCLTDCRCCTDQRQFCCSNESGEQGVIPETFRKRSGALRGCHPTHSWCALGAKSQRFLNGQVQSQSPCGKGNPFETLILEDGCIVCLGVLVNTITLWHYYEDLLNVPYLGERHPQWRHVSYCTMGRRIQYEYPGIMDDVVSAAGISKTGFVGKGRSRLIRAKDFNAFMATIFADDPYCMVLRPPDRASDCLAVDALRKAAAMLEAWRKGPQQPEHEFNNSNVDPEFVREDCPAFCGYHSAFGKDWPLCKANDRHPDLFKAGGLFSENGRCCCDGCSWNKKFPSHS